MSSSSYNYSELDRLDLEQEIKTLSRKNKWLKSRVDAFKAERYLVYDKEKHYLAREELLRVREELFDGDRHGREIAGLKKTIDDLRMQLEFAQMQVKCVGRGNEELQEEVRRLEAKVEDQTTLKMANMQLQSALEHRSVRPFVRIGRRQTAVGKMGARNNFGHGFGL